MNHSLRDLETQAESYFQREDIPARVVIKRQRSGKSNEQLRVRARLTLPCKDKCLESAIRFAYSPRERTIMNVDLLVEERYRGASYGARFVDFMERFGKELGAHRIYIDNSVNNDWWHSRGYKFLGYREQPSKNFAGFGEFSKRIR